MTIKHKSPLVKKQITVTGHPLKTKTGDLTYRQTHTKMDDIRIEEPTASYGTQKRPTSSFEKMLNEIHPSVGIKTIEDYHDAITEHITNLGLDPNNKLIASFFDPLLTFNKLGNNAKTNPKNTANQTFTETFKGQTLELNGYCKPVAGENLLTPGGFMYRDDITYNRKNTGNPLTLKEIVSIESILKTSNYDESMVQKITDNFKGTLAHRELATVGLAKLLQMSHIPTGTIRRLPDNKNIDRLCFISNDLNNALKFDKKGNVIPKDDRHVLMEEGDLISPDKLISPNYYGKLTNITMDKLINDLMDNLQASDHTLHDKMIFDYLAGNTDRHAGNMLFLMQRNDLKTLQQQQGKGNAPIKGTMLGIDHGLTFGSNGEKVKNYHDANLSFQPIINRRQNAVEANNMQVTPQFVDHYISLLDDYQENEENSKIVQYVDFLKDSIGEIEAVEFLDRFSIVGDYVDLAAESNKPIRSFRKFLDYI